MSGDLITQAAMNPEPERLAQALLDDIDGKEATL
jgi:hypothetical protein